MTQNHFRASLRDLRFTLWEMFPLEAMLRQPPYLGADRAHYDDLLVKGARFSHEIAASYGDADRAGCHLAEDGSVRIPPQFAQLWKGWNGWESLGAPAPGDDVDRGAIPALVKQTLMEMMMGANPAFMCYGGFTVPASALLREHGTARQKALLLDKLESFTWDACYCATEARAGSDLLAIGATASPLEGDTWSLRGEKRFITAGMHGLTENTVYLVLARPADAAPDSMFLSCYIVPRLWVDPVTGELSDNNVECTGVADKMGLRGCANTDLRFGARGVTRAWLLGDRRNAALLQFVALARHARVNSSLFALGLAACSTNASVEYAARRVQGTPLGSGAGTGATPIMAHADVRRMLLEMKARVEGIRTLVSHISWMSTLAGQARRAGRADDAARLRTLINMLVPLNKTYSADEAWRVCELGVQVHGGIGYTTEAAVEQYLRDVKILSIWEGTSYVQAFILVRDVFAYGRKPDALDLLDAWRAERARELGLPAAPCDRSRAVDTAFARCRAALAWVHAGMKAGELGASSAHFVAIARMLALAFVGWGMHETACVAEAALASADAADRPFYEGKRASTAFYFAAILPEVERLSEGIDATAGITIQPAGFAPLFMEAAQ